MNEKITGILSESLKILNAVNKTNKSFRFIKILSVFSFAAVVMINILGLIRN